MKTANFLVFLSFVKTSIEYFSAEIDKRRTQKLAHRRRTIIPEQFEKLLAVGIPGEIVKRITGHRSDAMLEGYEHVDAAMIGGLAAKLSNGKPLTALPLPQADIREQVRAALNRMNTKNWKTVRADLLASIAT